MTTRTWQRGAEPAWGELESRLAAWLAEASGADTLVIEQTWPDGDLGGASPYVQLAVEGGSVRAEAASNCFLDPRFVLDAQRLAALDGLGWREPTETPGGGAPNHWLHCDLPAEATRLAALLVTTLRKVYGVPAPSSLVVSGFSDDGAGCR